MLRRAAEHGRHGNGLQPPGGKELSGLLGAAHGSPVIQAAVVYYRVELQPPGRQVIAKAAINMCPISERGAIHDREHRTCPSRHILAVVDNVLCFWGEHFGHEGR
jgi:hypothetical protein